MLVLLAAIPAAAVENHAPGLADIRANSRSIPLYEKFELTFAAEGNWANPFDPDQVAIDCIVDPPQGARFVVPAFFYQAYDRTEVDGREWLQASGPACWKVRLAPTVTGTYRCRLRLKSAGPVVEADAGTFEATGNSNRPGFVRISSVNPRYLERDDGSSFFAIGENMLFPGGAGTYQMDKWLTSLARAGGNFIRTWWCHAGMDLESRVSAEPRRQFGVYDLASAWRADHELELAEALGVVVMPTIETQQYLRTAHWWDRFTYNAANGGPLAKPGDYFDNPVAARAFRNRLRYIVARWSYSTSIFSWQFWNEVDVCNDYDPAKVAAWHRDMAHYLRSIDPNRHIINTNYGNMDGRPEVDDLPETELVSTNLYTRMDSAESALEAARFMTPRRAKPYLLSEFGIGHYGRWARNDPTGIALHDGLWGAALGGAAGGALVWEWNDWVDPQNLYHHFAPFAAVMKAIPFARHAWRPIEVESFVFRDASRPPYYAGVFFEGFTTNYRFTTCPHPLPDVFTLTPEGNVDRPDCFNGRLMPLRAATGRENSERTETALAAPENARTFLMTMPHDGELVLHVPRLDGQQHPILQVTIDGWKVFERRLARAHPNDTWDYFGQFRFPLAAGEHRVTVANVQTATPEDVPLTRVTVAYELTNYRLRRGPDLDVAGLQSDAGLLVWLRNPQATWLFLREGRKITRQPEGLLRLRDVPDGSYAVVWRDTWTGEILGRDMAQARQGSMELRTPAVDRSAVATLARSGL
jgi:hypothetical protein